MRKHIGILIMLLVSVINALSQDLNEYLLRSKASLEAGSFSQAADICRRALSGFEDYRIYLILAEAQYGSGNPDEALISYQKANDLKKGSGELGMAYIYAGRNLAGEAVEHLGNHLRSDFKKAESELVLSDRFASVQSTPEWKELWRKSWYTEIEKALSESSYLIDNNRLDELKKLENDLLPLYRGEPGMLYLQALVSKAEGRKKEALAFFRQANAEGYESPEFYNNFIMTLMEERNFISAADECRVALDKYPSRSDYILMLAEANNGIGDRDKAIANAKLYLELFPDSEEGLSLAGKILNEQKNYSEALKYFSRSVELYPGNPDHYISRGDVYSRTGTWQYAISDYSMALDLYPANGDVYYMKGLALLKTGRRDDACRDFRMAVKYGNKKAASEINKNCIR